MILNFALSGAGTRLVRHFLFALVLVSFAGELVCQGQTELASTPLPPMGWSSWNSFSNTVDAQIVMAQAQAMATNGMQKAGYQYVNIDEGWWLGDRDAEGNIVVDPKAWPALASGEKAGDMANVVRFIHRLGLKAGIYTDAGADGCSMFPDLGPKYFHSGSEGHYDQDFLQFARWGFDFVKVDWCGGDKENLDPAVQYTEIARAIARAEKITGHRLYYSLCEWGKNSPWTWAPNVGGAPADIWRTSGDIVDPIVMGSKNANRRVTLAKVFTNFDQGVHPEAQHTGYFNDPDMMVLGMPGLSDEENRIHMSLWAMSGAPLLAGADLTTLSAANLATLADASVIAIDQDPLGLQAVKIGSPTPGLEVWSKLLAPAGTRAVLLLNRTTASADLAFDWKEIGLDDSKPAGVKDLWADKDLGSFRQSYATHLSGSGFALLLLHGTDGKAHVYQPVATTAGHRIAKTPLVKDHPVTFENVTSHFEIAPVEITYSNPAQTPRIAELRVNGQGATRISFPPTGAGKSGRVWVQARLDRGAKGNSLVFSTQCDEGPSILALAVR